MKNQYSRFHKLILWGTSIALLCVLTAVVVFFFLFPKNLRQDFHRLSHEEFDSVFLSMYPIDTYEEEDFTHYRAMNTVQTTHEIPNQFILKSYLWKIQRSGQLVHTIYLGIQPDKLSGTELASLLSSYPNYHFQIILPYPSLDYWTGLSEQECSRKLQAYLDCIPPLLEQPNASVYFFGSSEWLIANPANYESDFLTTADISRTIMLNSDEKHPYLLNASTYMSHLDKLESVILQARNNPPVYADLTGESIVFFGDSVIGNFTDTTSIPLVTGALTGAATYNLGYGGTPATSGTHDGYAFSDIIKAFLCKDLSALPADCQAWAGLNEYLANPADNPYCFVINYGLNDYYNGAPIASEDPYDIYTFEGAIRAALRDLQIAYPNARIIIATPNFTANFNNGMDYTSEHKHIITDYVDALIAVADEMHVELLDNYNELDINAQNHGLYLSDKCHPNAAGRFIMGKRIALALSK